MYQPMIVGLTGNIATGKSTVLAYLRHKGAHILDADQLAHVALAAGGPAYAAVVAAFGDSIVAEDGQIDRRGLGRIVFADEEALRRLEALVHPVVFQLAQTELANTTAPVVIIEAIKLLESGRLLTLCDEIWVVTADPAVQMERLLHQRGMTTAEAHQRMAAQSPQREKLRHATRVIENNGAEAALYAQLEVIWSELLAKQTM
ncbi:dephospho-CoA kinase [Caldilinea sp.]|uniref:dephospho-CoA kinase n=1 Tax=Caldilinea sp. TaxID=2293560 RepID=UPI002C0BF9B1|nr:dephospho-CoA kinase [Caldilinea sp.]